MLQRIRNGLLLYHELANLKHVIQLAIKISGLYSINIKALNDIEWQRKVELIIPIIEMLPQAFSMQGFLNSDGMQTLSSKPLFSSKGYRCKHRFKQNSEKRSNTITNVVKAHGSQHPGQLL